MQVKDDYCMNNFWSHWRSEENIVEQGASSTLTAQTVKKRYQKRQKRFANKENQNTKRSAPDDDDDDDHQSIFTLTLTLNL